MEWRVVIWLAACGCFDLVWQCCHVTLSEMDKDSTARVTPAWPIYKFPTSNTGSKKYHLWKKHDSLKNRLFFITENFLGILNRLCAETMHRSHDFLNWMLAIVGSTSGRCYFLQQCQCLSVFCVFLLLDVWSVKWVNQKRFDVFYNHHHHHHIALSAWIFLTLSLQTSQSSIAFGRSSGLHPVLAQNCCM